MTCRDCIHENVCGYYVEFKDNADECKHFKNKADFMEVVRCDKCKHGDVSTFSMTKDGQEEVACYCNLKKAVTDVDYYCASGERK